MFALVRRVNPTPKTPPARPQRFRPRVQPLDDRVVPSTLMVHKGLDDGSKGTLRYEAGIAKDGDEIRFDAHVHNVYITNGPIEINARIRIDGKQLPDEASSNAKLIHEVNLINTVKGLRFLTVGENDNVTFSDLDLSGFVGMDPNLPDLDGQGGAFLNFGTLTLDDCDLHDNTASANGGAITNYGTLNLINCNIHGNTAGDEPSPGLGGGVANFGTMTVTDSTFSNNTANAGTQLVLEHFPDGEVHEVAASVGGIGGGICNLGTADLTNVTVSDNTAAGHLKTLFTLSDASGGGIYNGGAMDIHGGMISGNSATLGGGIFNAPIASFGDSLAGDHATIDGITLANNTAGLSGGGIYDLGTMNLTGSFVFGNSALFGGGIYKEGFLNLSIGTTDFSTDGGARPPNSPTDIEGDYQDSGGNTFTI
jgi:hypothetical protein